MVVVVIVVVVVVIVVVVEVVVVVMVVVVVVVVVVQSWTRSWNQLEPVAILLIENQLQPFELKSKSYLCRI